MPAKHDKEIKRISWLKRSMILGYAAIIMLITVLITALTVNKTGRALKTKVSSMTSSLNVQMQMNVDSYLKRMETMGTLVFAAEEVYMYDPIAENNNSYESLQTEKIISDKLFDLCIMENFVDFGIVYRNNHIVGKISNGTKELFGENLYTDLSSFINRPRTNDGWQTGYNGNYKRIYYTKKINENAVLVISLYATELKNVLEHSQSTNDVTIRLIDDNFGIIYSSDIEEIGGTLPDSIRSRIEDVSASTVMDNKYLVTMSDCGDNWQMLCSVPTGIIMKEKNEIQIFIIIVGISAMILAILLSIFLSQKISNPVNNMLAVLDTKAHIDQLTGTMNKRSFEETIENALASPYEGSGLALIILDIDNFKHVNDTLGHDNGDKVLADVGDVLRAVFRSGDFIGRLGGDEFCVGMRMSLISDDYCHKLIKKKCEELCGAFRNKYMGDNHDYKISVSIGASFSPEHGSDFSTLYKCADSALYNSKRSGKDTYTIYSEELK